ncbi:squalene/phytoene synthase family protein [Streptomyces sp. NPDC057445]|uniref:squalene/phytoene synthase family protein n=1 Tax=Streptomyces sp. NPDC057445 TaxID=3346136 RepID=UPI0036B21E29
MRLLLPAAIVPDVIAATAFMHYSDNLIDQGSLDERLESLGTWDRQVKGAFASGSADEPVLRTLIDTASRHPQLAEHVQRFLAGAPAEVQWEGFETDDAFRRYVDAYSHPAFMIIACLLETPPHADEYRAECRTFIESSQRLDFLEDLADDLRAGRLGIPYEALAECRVTRADLERSDALGRVGDLIRNQVALARPGLVVAQRLADLVESENRHFMTALVRLQLLRLDAVEKAGSSVARKPPDKPVAAALGLLVRAYRSAHNARQPTG